MSGYAVYSVQALWFTADKGGIGPVFGNVVDWRGVGVVLDSFDNDGKVFIVTPPPFPPPHTHTHTHTLTIPSTSSIPSE